MAAHTGRAARARGRVSAFAHICTPREVRPRERLWRKTGACARVHVWVQGWVRAGPGGCGSPGAPPPRPPAATPIPPNEGPQLPLCRPTQMLSWTSPLTRSTPAWGRFLPPPPGTGRAWPLGKEPVVLGRGAAEDSGTGSHLFPRNPGILTHRAVESPGATRDLPASSLQLPPGPSLRCPRRGSPLWSALRLEFSPSPSVRAAPPPMPRLRSPCPSRVLTAQQILPRHF